MDDSTQKVMLGITVSILRKVLTVGGASLATHGLINSNQTEMFVSGGLAVAGLAWSFWKDYGQAIVLSHLDVLKAKSLAQAAALQVHNIPPPTVTDIADQSTTLTPNDVAKAVIKMDAQK